MPGWSFVGSAHHEPPSTYGGSTWVDTVVSVPAGTADGDVMFGLCVTRAASVTTPAGWNLISVYNPGGVGQVRYLTFYRTASSEPANYTFDNSTTSIIQHGAIATYRNIIIGTPSARGIWVGYSDAGGVKPNDPSYPELFAAGATAQNSALVLYMGSLTACFGALFRATAASITADPNVTTRVTGFLQDEGGPPNNADMGMAYIGDRVFTGAGQPASTWTGVWQDGFHSMSGIGIVEITGFTAQQAGAGGSFDVVPFDSRMKMKELPYSINRGSLR